MTSTYGLSGSFLRWPVDTSQSQCGAFWQSWAISSASFVPVRYLEKWFLSWSMLHLSWYASWRWSFLLASSCRCNIWFCTCRVRHFWGGLCGLVGAIQSRGVWRLFVKSVKTKPKLRLLWQRHSEWRRCPISQRHTMLRTQPLVTTKSGVYLPSAFSKGNSEGEAQLPARRYNNMSFTLSWCTCYWTLMKWFLIERKFSMS